MLLFLHIPNYVAQLIFILFDGVQFILKLKMSNKNICPQLLPWDYVQGQETDDQLVIVHTLHSIPSGKDLVF